MQYSMLKNSFFLFLKLRACQLCCSTFLVTKIVLLALLYFAFIFLSTLEIVLKKSKVKKLLKTNYPLILTTRIFKNLINVIYFYFKRNQKDQTGQNDNNNTKPLWVVHERQRKLTSSLTQLNKTLAVTLNQMIRIRIKVTHYGNIMQLYQIPIPRTKSKIICPTGSSSETSKRRAGMVKQNKRKHGGGGVKKRGYQRVGGGGVSERRNDQTGAAARVRVRETTASVSVARERTGCEGEDSVSLTRSSSSSSALRTILLVSVPAAAPLPPSLSSSVVVVVVIANAATLTPFGSRAARSLFVVF